MRKATTAQGLLNDVMVLRGKRGPRPASYDRMSSHGEGAEVTRNMTVLSLTDRV